MELIGYIIFFGLGFYAGTRANKFKLQDDVARTEEFIKSLDPRHFNRAGIKILQKKELKPPQEETIDELERTFTNKRPE